MDSAVKRISTVLFILFAVLIIRLFQVSVLESEKLSNDPHNKREILLTSKVARGKIISRDGEILAYSAKTDRGYKRIYPYGEKFAHLTGYFSQRYGASFSEAYFNDVLSGNPSQRFWSPGKADYKNVRISVDSRLQKKAFSLLKQKGAIAAVEVKTGRILCLVSYPSFDPNKVDESFESWKKKEGKPLLNRVTSGVYPPGSTFKILTLATYLESIGSLEDIYDAPAVFKVGGFRITNYGGKSYGKITVKDAFKYSVNTVFAQMGLSIGPYKFKSSCIKCGFGGKTGVEIPESTGRLPAKLDDPVILSWSAVGQADLNVTPLQMLAFTAAIANKGVWVKPTILMDGNTSTAKRIIDERTAELVTQAMVEVVRSGTGTRARIRGLKVAGKTGTAEVEGGKPHAWFVGFAPAENPEIAAVVILENAGSGGTESAPLFKKLVEYYFFER
ncbi:MAG: penicillin-binding protein 2 [Actinobacteria bacterium]|nr:penicillin-binding protein 2 [Actinomycetota bacterium]